MSDYIHTKDGREIPASQYIRELHAEQATWKERAERYLRDMGLGFKRIQELEDELDAMSKAAAVIEAAVAYHDQWAVPSNVVMHQARHLQLMDAVNAYQKGLGNV